MTYVLVNIVSNTRHDITDSPFEVTDDFVWLEITGEVSEEAYFDETSGAIIDPANLEKTLQETYDSKKSELKSFRNQEIFDGFMIPNTPLRLELTETTERRLTAANEKAKEAIAADTEFNVDWEIDEDNWATLDATTIVVLADMAASHIQSCYTQHKFHFDQLKTLFDSSDKQGIIDYDFTTGW